MNENNMMRGIMVEKVTLNIGCGKDQAKLEKGLTLLKHLSGIKPVKTFTKKRIQEWGLRPGLPIGCKVTLRNDNAKEMIKRTLDAKSNRLTDTQFDEGGNISFGISEYIDIPEAKYDPKIGIMGLQVCITLERPGFRIKKRRLLRKKIPVNHKILREESMNFMKKEFKIKIGEDE